jgi:antitoxin (DNA-binding transcriptional repressor) of toxin-antitoxin stability system
MQASVREFKARLSHYLKRAEAGETVIVTSRGRPIARLSGPPPTEGKPISATELRRRLRDLPGIIPAQGSPGLPRPIKSVKRGKPVSDIVLEDRD